MAHPDTPLPEPTFIPKYLATDTEHAERFHGVAAALVPANFVASDRYQVDARAREACDVLLIDPQTNYFTYGGYLERRTYMDIPYAPHEVAAARNLLYDERDTRDFAERVLDFQRQNGADVLVAPYFYARDLDDARYIANLRLLGAARELIQPGEQLYAAINISGTVLRSPRQLDEIAGQYEGPNPHGFLLSFENIDDRYVALETLYGLARLTQRLSVARDVVIYPIAAFGQVLTAIGANGFVSGVGWLEVFRETNLQPGRAGFAPGRTPRAQMYYVPELFSYLNPHDAATIHRDCHSARDFVCNCPHCNGGIPEAVPVKKRHFLRRRHEEMAELAEAANRPQHIRDRLNRALELSEIIEDEALVRVETAHLLNWLQVLDLCQRAAPDEEPPDVDELDRLIAEERRRRDAPPDA